MASYTRTAKVLPHVQQARAEGFRTYRAIAAYLNRRGIRTSRGKEWLPASVRRLIPTDRLLGQTEFATNNRSRC
jgi:hypothetical protein